VLLFHLHPYYNILYYLYYTILSILHIIIIIIIIKVWSSLSSTSTSPPPPPSPSSLLLLHSHTLSCRYYIILYAWERERNIEDYHPDGHTKILPPDLFIVPGFLYVYTYRCIRGIYIYICAQCPYLYNMYMYLYSGARLASDGWGTTGNAYREQ